MIVDRFASADEAIAEADRLSLGLAAYAWTGSPKTAERLSRTIQAGNPSIDHWAASFPETRFGGVKDSGVGKEGGGAPGLPPGADRLCAGLRKR